MQITPEVQILVLNGLILAVAYLGIFPTLEQKTLNRMMAIDFVLTGVALVVAGAWFWGTGVTFTLAFFETNWFMFTIVCFALLEIPLFLRFAKAHGIRLDGREDDE